MVRRRKHLGEEDRKLWKKVTESIAPLSVRRQNQFVSSRTSKPAELKPSFQEKIGHRLKKISSEAVKPARLEPKTPVSNAFDHKTRKNIARGRLPIDARIDLHGMNQEQANNALRHFLHMAQASDFRLVLVITGKGDAGQGILRRRVPDWLAVGEFASMINGVQEAHISHGGSGALYVRIKRM